MIKILIVEDEDAISNLIKLTLAKADYQGDIARDGEIALNMIDNNIYDLILLDVMIPKIDGFELMTYLKDRNIPVIFITAMSGVDYKVKGLDLGADDYITKPFDLTELIARINSVLRRNNKAKTKLTYKNIEIDIPSHTVYKDNIPINLTKKEFDLVLLLFENKNIALYREVIYERIWNEDYLTDSRTVDLHIQRVRKKLNLVKEIETVFKVGYRFNPLDEI